VRPEVAEPSRVPGAPRERGHAVLDRERQDRFLDAIDARDMRRLAVRGRPVAALRPPPAPEHGGRHDADLDDTGGFERDQRRPHRDAARVVPRAVDRVEYPASRAATRSAPLLAEDRVVGPLVGEEPPELSLDRAVRLGHRRQVWLRLDRKLRAEARQRDRVRRIGQVQREIEVGAHRADTNAASRG
jgi:hypothetical protein